MSQPLQPMTVWPSKKFLNINNISIESFLDAIQASSLLYMEGVGDILEPCRCQL